MKSPASMRTPSTLQAVLLFCGPQLSGAFKIHKQALSERHIALVSTFHLQALEQEG